MIRALIAGRTRVHREALAVALSQARGVRVLGTASHREEILARLVEAPPDIVLVDFAMPEAATIVAEIRRRTPSVKVVAITLGVPDGSLDDLIIAVESAVRGELYCPPRVAFTLLRRVGAIALGSVTASKEQAALSPVHELTGREREILQLVDQGMSNKQIARHLGIEVATAKNHVHNILQKLHVHRRIDASSWYRQGGFHLKLEA